MIVTLERMLDVDDGLGAQGNINVDILTIDQIDVENAIKTFHIDDMVSVDILNVVRITIQFDKCHDSLLWLGGYNILLG
jgi:hypothetical protein